MPVSEYPECNDEAAKHLAWHKKLIDVIVCTDLFSGRNKQLNPLIYYWLGTEILKIEKTQCWDREQGRESFAESLHLLCSSTKTNHACIYQRFGMLLSGFYTPCWGYNVLTTFNICTVSNCWVSRHRLLWFKIVSFVISILYSHGTRSQLPSHNLLRCRLLVIRIW